MALSLIRVPTYIRWILVLPAFLVGFFVATYLARIAWVLGLLVLPVGDFSFFGIVELPTGDFFYAIYLLFENVLGAFSAVWLARLVAPRRQRMVAVFAGGILLLVFPTLFVFAILFTDTYDGLGWWITIQDSINGLGTGVGALIGILVASPEESEVKVAAKDTV